MFLPGNYIMSWVFNLFVLCCGSGIPKPLTYGLASTYAHNEEDSYGCAVAAFPVNFKNICKQFCERQPRSLWKLKIIDQFNNPFSSRVSSVIACEFVNSNVN